MGIRGVGPAGIDESFGASAACPMQRRLRVGEGRSGVFDEDQLLELGRAERLRLIRALVALESPAPAADRVVRRRQAMALAAIIVCCVILCGHRLGGLASRSGADHLPGGAGLAAVLRRLVRPGSGRADSGLRTQSAVRCGHRAAMATLAGWGARRLLQMGVAVVRRDEGQARAVAGLWRARLIGSSPGSDLRELFSELDPGESDSGETSGEAQDHPRDGPAA